MMLKATRYPIDSIDPTDQINSTRFAVPTPGKNPFTFLSNAETHYISSLYEEYLKSPESLDESWKNFFQGFELAQRYYDGMGTHSNKSQSQNLSQNQNQNQSNTNTSASASANPQGNLSPHFHLEIKAYKLIEAYRHFGHYHAQTSPLKNLNTLNPLKSKISLEPSAFGLTQNDLNHPVSVAQELSLAPTTTLTELIEQLKKVYLGPIGIEMSHIQDPQIKEWVLQKFEKESLDYSFDLPKKERILRKLNEASVFENFLHTKYIGQKRFSLEGGENTIPAMDAIINLASSLGVKEVVIGMAHRGRLNILSNIMGKTYEEIFSEFEGKVARPDNGDGDVKYHLGFTTKTKTTYDKSVILKLMPNPSHLEAVGPVVLGYTRGRGEDLYQSNFKEILPIIIHGDASVAGQGIVYEALQMSQLEATETGGCLHFVINNQIGFTTPSAQSRSSDYCTSIGKLLDAPILHVNGDNAEACVYAVEFATEFRQKFAQDIFIDMVCYRKYGHNEGDEPRYTQPVEYKEIDSHSNPREIYLKQLIANGKIEENMAKDMVKEFRQMLQDRLNQVKERPVPPYEHRLDAEWRELRKSNPDDFNESPATGVSLEKLKKVLDVLSQRPSHINPINKMVKTIEGRKETFDQNKIDWALAELLSYGSLLLKGHNIRIHGQDVLRGTFSHRHAVIFDQDSGESFCQLNELSSKVEKKETEKTKAKAKASADEGEVQPGKFWAFNSLLSEYACLAFEYGHSMVRPSNLTIWEAQFGDFSNNAQTVIDQFISSAESKWQTMSGLVLYLPHGYEGQGPEHSSARAERYLQLCAEFNMVVVNPTTPANFFHVIIRQLYFPFRKPLIVLTPKSLLRHPECISTQKELISGKFEEFFDDTFVNKAPTKVKKVLLCTGKIYYDLMARQRRDERKDIAIIRLEQLHPIPFERIDKVIQQYKNAQKVWVQEEPKNMGFWNYILRKLDYHNLTLVSRKSSASTATGYSSVHLKEQEEILQLAFKID
jgi:2-oxoglutarate dehydrogenase E1 component